MGYYNYGARRMKVSDMLNMTMERVEQNDDDEVHFYTTDGRHFVLYHCQDCCEHVYIESIVGDLQDLIGAPLLLSEESTSTSAPPDGFDEDRDSFTWTFYKFATIKGYVDIRFFGTSNGYYSETADFVEVL